MVKHVSSNTASGGSNNFKYKLDIKFFANNLYLVVATIILYLLNLYCSYNGLLVYEAREEVSSSVFYFYIVLTIFIITIPSVIFSYLLNLFSQKMNVESRLKKVVLNICLIFLLFLAFVAQIPSTWYSFESLFRQSYYSQIKSRMDIIENQILEKKALIKDKKDNLSLIKANLMDKIKNNNLRIEKAKNRHLELDFTFVTMKKDLQKEINNAIEENKALLLELEEYEDKIAELDNKLASFIAAKNIEKTKTQGINVLFKDSSIVDKENYIEYYRTWFLVLLSSMLDLTIGILLISIYKARQKYVKEVVLDPKLSRETVGKTKFDIRSKLSPVKKVFDFSKKMLTRKGGNVSNIGKKLFDALDFVSSCLKEDKATIKSVGVISKETGKTRYFVRQKIALLVESNLVSLKNRRYILNTAAVSNLTKLVNKSRDKKIKTLFDKYSFTTLLSEVT
ncbi:hypothetical protein F0310_05560 (plasmid) [Borrelia sp. A-FGy1]|uniref:hypothetical protein n=1 Tax=Borrelia sp. A-FGy1 TaxID=2608247 RepID=UPI0015F735DA|nr:hypothetical protein [Borrelia sp. A-FGy1]QMU99876.1 hypothetical protein F0310_05560 [Borrelia sp. A-FGy1]